MKYLSIATVAALLALCSFSKASAQTVDLYFGATITNQTLTFDQPFTETTFFPNSLLNSILSATLTAKKAGLPASATITADVYLEEIPPGPPPQTPTLVDAVLNETLSLSPTTTTSTTQTINTTGYPTTFYDGPGGTFNTLVVDVTGSSLENALVSFTGLAELEAIPEPSTWALLLGGVGVLFVAARFRRTTVRS